MVASGWSRRRGSTLTAVKRVVVVGCIGAGKSTVARALGARHGLEVIHLDQLWWEPGPYKITGWRSVEQHTIPPTAFRRVEVEITARESWVIDGGVANIDLRLIRADTVVFLDLPRWMCTWQLLKRHNRPRADYPDGVSEGLGWLWLLVKWIWTTWPRERRPAVIAAIKANAAEARVVRLRTRSDLDAFLTSLRVPSRRPAVRDRFGHRRRE
jgi:adenylate kinase family enzyme